MKISLVKILILTFSLFLSFKDCFGLVFPIKDCFSCNIKIESLDSPVSLAGKWLFTRNDNIENKNPDKKLDDKWVLVNTPGAWKKAYGDGKNFRVGW